MSLPQLPPDPQEALRKERSSTPPQSKVDADSATTHSYLPAIGRFLIVVTFLEDALRIITQWSDQLTYLHDYRHSKAPPPPHAPTALQKKSTLH